MSIDVDCRSETDVTAAAAAGKAGAAGSGGSAAANGMDNRLMVPSGKGAAAAAAAGRAGSPGAGYQRRRKLSTAGKVRKFAPEFHNQVASLHAHKSAFFTYVLIRAPTLQAD